MKIIGYKGFDKNLKCMGMQYSVGETFEYEGEVSLCNSGLHFCEFPTDVLEYYPACIQSRYCVVSTDCASEERGDDSKRVTSRLTVVRELSAKELVEIGLKDLIIKGNLFLSDTGITSLPTGLHVGGCLDLRDTGITSLPENLHVGGSLFLSDTGVTSLPENLHVGGSIYKDF